jgi:hypothetical protein
MTTNGRYTVITILAAEAHPLEGIGRSRFSILSSYPLLGKRHLFPNFRPR